MATILLGDSLTQWPDAPPEVSLWPDSAYDSGETVLNFGVPGGTTQTLLDISSQ